MIFSDKDLVNMGQRINSENIDISTADSLIVSAEEAFNESPASKLVDYAYQFKGEKVLTAQQANQEFDLTGTSAAFDEADDELISREHAENVRNRYVERTANESYLQSVDEQTDGWMAVGNFLASIGGSALDPINISTGFAASKILKAAQVGGKFAYEGGSKALKKFLNSGSFTSIASRQIAENTLAGVATDVVISPLGDEAVNQERTISQRAQDVFTNIIAGAMFGTAAEFGAAKFAGAESARTRGTDSADIESEKMAVKTYEADQGLAPSRIVETKEDIAVFTPREGQATYEFKAATKEDLPQKSFFRGKRLGQEVEVSYHGENVKVYTENFNHAHNYTQKMDPESIGEVTEVSLKDSNILMDEDFADNKGILGVRMQTEIDSLPKKSAGKLKKSLGKAFKEADSIVELKRMLHESAPELDGHIIDDLVNNSLKAEGYDGYHFVGEGETDFATNYNGVAMFDDTKVEVEQITPTIGFDRTTPMNLEIDKSLKSELKNYIKRSEDYRQLDSYDAEVEKKVDSVYDRKSVKESFDGLDDFVAENEDALTQLRESDLEGDKKLVKVVDDVESTATKLDEYIDCII